jgi:hypothetical protein
MAPVRPLFPMKRHPYYLFASLFLLFISFCFAQDSAKAPAGLRQVGAPAQASPPSSGSSPGSQQVPEGKPDPAATRDAAKASHRLTAEEKENLLASVEEVLRFASQDTLLPIKHSVKKSIVSREQVEKYLDDKFKSDVDRVRFERSELVLKKFGLLPRSFELHSFLIKLLGEQVAGFYNEKSKTMNLLDWVESDLQKPVMAHELTHALQDQSYDLEKMSKHDDEVEKRGLEDLDLVIREDERSTCRSAIMEGQAMIVYLDYVLAPMGTSVEKAPKTVDLMQSSIEKSNDSPIFDSAPLLLQQELIFPYRQGMGFIKELLVAGGKKLAYSGVLDRMPLTTREIMEPAEYLAGRRVPPLLLPDLNFLKKDFEPYDAGAVGELDVSILLQVYADDATAKRLSREWRGGSYYAAGRKGAKPVDKNSSSHVGLYYISKWSNEAAAREFAKIYSAALARRYSGLERQQTDPRPGLEKYGSADGPIFIQQTGNLVVAVESFDPVVADRLIELALKHSQDTAATAASGDKR